MANYVLVAMNNGLRTSVYVSNDYRTEPSGLGSSFYESTDPGS